ncbi:hypothetical protein [Patulibacter minatonensis]|uniref:hypothetical protein n=1 Tax=Patulibacter minatonensis TaxID=298163 RepID=UPI00047934DE|nr:hypothetical protein [Patulibacter minatonensis]
MPGTDDGPARALRAGVEHLQRLIDALQSELRDAVPVRDAVVDPLVHAIEARQQELARWRAALEIAEPGAGPDPLDRPR